MSQAPALYPSVDPPDPPPLPPPPHPLPSEWASFIDDASGTPYFVNSRTGETTFEQTHHAHRSSSPPPSSRTSAAEPAAAEPAASAARRLIDALFGVPPPAATPPASPLAPPTRVLSPHSVSEEACGYSVVVRPTPPPRTRGREVFVHLGARHSAAAAAAAVVPPVWQPDSAACARCAQGFGLLRRRTHCRNCGYTFCHGCCTTWPRNAVPPSYLLPSEQTPFIRVCHGCDQAATAFRLALLSGDLGAVQAAYGGGSKNVNLRSPLHFQSKAQLLPVHYAASRNSLDVLRWLVEEMCCPVTEARALSSGRQPKSALRVAIEHCSVDVMQWLVGVHDAPPHAKLPLSLSTDTGCSPAALHRALEASLKEGWRQRSLVSLTLSQLPAAQRAPLGHEREGECVVCLAAPADHVLVPCGHACCCPDCCRTISLCPICRAPVERAVRLYHS
ncbi:hypothetical protein AB1Y20_021086 [Prymnesium parvum]|uniref:RING-type E3 ubiquitin transferase n=1 Tax=Prymnesium parvum TaxID=97485 RepID=A0AB34JL31_PRYPA